MSRISARGFGAVRDAGRGARGILPECVASKSAGAGPWAVSHTRGTPCTGIAEHVMRVPLHGESEGFLAIVTRHELAHAWLSPRFPKRPPKGVHPMLLQATEDMRISVLASSRAHVSLDGGLRAMLEGGAVPRAVTDPAMALGLLVCSRANQHDFVAAVAMLKNPVSLEAVDVPFCFGASGEALNRMTRRGSVSWRRTVKIARWLTSLLKETKNQTVSGIPARGDGSGEWLPMETIRYPMHVPSVPSRRWRPVDTGSAVRYTHRLPLDGRAFAARRRGQPMGSVLLDASGSMRENADALRIAKLLKSCPGASIGAYSTGNRGRLRILAMGGRRVGAVEDRASWGHGNGVDGLALRWLATQPAPRVWISDEAVSGVEGITTMKCLDDCRQVCHDHHIKVVRTVDQATEFLQGRRG